MLLFADGFDHYGSGSTGESNMLDGVYADVLGDGSGPSTTVTPATGTYSYYFGQGHTGNVNDCSGLRKVLPTAVDTLGIGMHLYFPQLPNGLAITGNAMICGMFPSATLANSQISFFVGSTGNIVCHRGGDGDTSLMGTELFATDPLLVASAWNHIEIQASIHDTEGWVRIAVNGVHRYEATGLDTMNHASGTVGQILMSRPYLGEHNTSCRWYMDNLYIYDFTGTAATYTDWCPTVDGGGVATNYMGEWQCMYLPPNADTAEDDWAPSTGSDAYAVVDETTPDDADYISSSTAGDLTEMALTDLPEDITVVRGLMLVGRMSKSDAGPALTTFGMKSVAAIDDADERPITVEPTYWWDFINVDPNSSARWTRASLNAAWIRLTRTA
jgi:hypothetical protein